MLLEDSQGERRGKEKMDAEKDNALLYLLSWHPSLNREREAHQRSTSMGRRKEGGGLTGTFLGYFS